MTARDLIHRLRLRRYGVKTMSKQYFKAGFSTSAPENYERCFVPAIGAPMAESLVPMADLQPGERVLDVGCGTGIVARLAAERVGESGSVTGLDLNPQMLAVARAATPGASIDWREASAESMPLPDEAFDAVFCALSLQFVPDRPRALREMHRVLVDGGRLALNLPGPIPRLFAVVADAMGRHVSPAAAGFVRAVFSLHDVDELERLLEGAGFRETVVRTLTRTLILPPPEAFLWQYVHSAPLVAEVARTGEGARNALEREILDGWKDEVEGGKLKYVQEFLLATARR